MNFSIIIPAFNEEAYIASCLKSINELDYPKHLVEVIVVDNGSTDRTPEIAKREGAIVLRNDEMNVSGLRNFGASKAKGDVLAFVDADCLVKKDLLQQASSYFDRQDVVAWGSPPIVPENATWVPRTWYVVRKKEKVVQDVDWLESMNLFVRKEHFAAIGGFNESLITCEDVDFCYRLQKHGKIVSDSTIQVVHLGEAATVKEFIAKEIWRGKSNFEGIRSHGFSLAELPSLFIPIYFGFFLPLVFLLVLFLLDPSWFVFVFLLYCLPSAAFLYKMRGKVEMTTLLPLLLLVQVYFVSRTIAVIK